MLWYAALCCKIPHVHSLLSVIGSGDKHSISHVILHDTTESHGYSALTSSLCKRLGAIVGVVATFAVQITVSVSCIALNVRPDEQAF